MGECFLRTESPVGVERQHPLQQVHGRFPCHVSSLLNSRRKTSLRPIPYTSAQTTLPERQLGRL